MAEFKTMRSGCSKNSLSREKNKKDPGRNQGYIKWNKENLQGTNSGEDEAEIQINDLKHKEEISIQPEQQEEKNNSKQWG